MRRPIALAALAAAAVALACARRPEPSPDYAEARARHAALAARAEAPADAELDEVLALLARVPPGSADAASAAELRARVEEERRSAAEERARRAAAIAQASAAPRMPAGALAPPPPLRLARGATLAELQQQGEGCFVREGEVELEEGARVRLAEAWRLKEDAACAERFAPQRGQWLLFADGAFVAARPASEAREGPRTIPAGAAKLPVPHAPVPPPREGAPAPQPDAGGAR